MRRNPSLSRVLSVLAIALLAPAAGAGPVLRAGEDLFVEKPGDMEFTGRLIVRPIGEDVFRRRGLTFAAARDRIAGARARLAGDVIIHYQDVDEYVIRLGPGQSENTRAAQLLATGDYQYVHPDWRVFPTVIPNDPNFPNQWQHVNMRSPEAWDLQTGDRQIICAICDTGIDVDHPDLQDALVPGYHAPSRTAEVDGGPVDDINGHGTFVGGCAAAIGNNGVGVAGCGWNLSLMPVRVTNASDGSAFLSAILDGARWAVEHGAKVASASYSGVAAASIETTGEYIKSIGGLFCYAAGNSSTDLSSFDHQDVVVVGASTRSDSRAGFSSFGRGVDLFAPGVDVWSTRRGGGYGSGSGTSFSTPMANGSLGMIWSVNPSFSPATVERILFFTADDLGAPGDDDVFGWGRINQFSAIQLAIQAATTALPPVAVDDAQSLFRDETVVLDPTTNDYDLNDDALRIVAFDSTSAAGGSVTLSPGTGTDGRDVLVYLSAPGYSGPDTIAYTIDDGTGLQASAVVSLDVLDPDAFRDPDNPFDPSPGVDASYFALSSPTALPDFSSLEPYASEVVNRVRFLPTSGDFAGSGRADDVGATFEGFVNVPETAQYTFWTSSDDGSRLLIGDQVVVDNDGLHGMQDAEGTILLKAGMHAIRVEFFEAGGDAGLIARIEGGGLVRQPIPSFMWFRGRCPADLSGDDTADVRDFMIFVLAFALSDPLADLTQDGQVNVADFFAFISAFQDGC